MPPPSPQPTRRTFLAAGVGALAGCAASRARVPGANATVRIGVVGLNGRGRDLVAGFHRVRGTRIWLWTGCHQSRW